MDDTPTAALYDHGVSKHKWCNHRLIGQNKGSVYSVQYFCCYGFIIWCHDLGLSRPPRGPVCVCVAYSVFCTPLSWLCLFYGGQFMSCKDLTFCQQLRTVCSKKRSDKIPRTHIQKLRYLQTRSFSESHWFFFSCCYAGASFAIMHHYCADHFIEDRIHTCTRVQLPPGSLLAWRAQT